MKPKSSFFVFAIFLTITFSSPCLVAQSTGPCEIPIGGIGGTGFSSLDADQPQNGLGGTGFSDPQAFNGIGGTGKTDEGETLGIQGVITGFGSICIGATEIHYDASTPVQIGEQTASTKDLALGQVVKLTAQNTKQGWATGSIQVVENIRGPVTKMGRDTFKIMNQKVRLVEGTVISDSLKEVSVGASLSVSGFRRQDGVWVASRIDSAPADSASQISGPVTSLGDGKFKVGKTQILFRQTQTERPLKKEQQVRVVGQWDGKHLVAQDIQIRDTTPFRNNPHTIQVEGFLQDRVKGGRLRIDAYDITLDQKTQALKDLRRNDFVKIKLRIDGKSGGSPRVERVERLDRAHLEHPDRGNKSEAEHGGGDHRGRSRDDQNDNSGHGSNGSGGQGSGSSGSGNGGSNDRGSNLRPESNGNSGREGRTERPNDFRGSGSDHRFERPDRIERPQKIERPQRPERPFDGSGRGRDH